MTKVLVEMEPELWSHARAYAKEHDLTNNDLVRLAVERLVLPVAGRAIDDRLRFPVPGYRDVTPMTYEEVERRTAPLPSGPSFGRSYAAPKPLKKGK